jgi:hypothetical protein
MTARPRGRKFAMRNNQRPLPLSGAHRSGRRLGKRNRFMRYIPTNTMRRLTTFIAAGGKCAQARLGGAGPSTG